MAVRVCLLFLVEIGCNEVCARVCVQAVETCSPSWTAPCRTSAISTCCWRRRRSRRWGGRWWRRGVAFAASCPCCGLLWSVMHSNCLCTTQKDVWSSNQSYAETLQAFEETPGPFRFVCLCFAGRQQLQSKCKSLTNINSYTSCAAALSSNLLWSSCCDDVSLKAVFCVEFAADECLCVSGGGDVHAGGDYTPPDADRRPEDANHGPTQAACFQWAGTRGAVRGRVTTQSDDLCSVINVSVSAPFCTD